MPDAHNCAYGLFRFKGLNGTCIFFFFSFYFFSLFCCHVEKDTLLLAEKDGKMDGRILTELKYVCSLLRREKCFLLSDRRQMGPPIIFMKIPKTPNKRPIICNTSYMNTIRLHQRDTIESYAICHCHCHTTHTPLVLHNLYSGQFKVRVLRKAISLLQLATFQQRRGSGGSFLMLQ